MKPIIKKVEEKFLKAVKQHKLAVKGDKILISCSGGPDSVLLVHLFNKFKNQLGLQILIAYFNHQLRGEDSAKEQDFAESMAKRLGIEIKSIKINPKAVKKTGLEESARILRYETLEKMARAEKCSSVALGHHLDDTVETVLFNMLRGSSVAGLKGMPVKRHMKGGGIIIRPLLYVRKPEILNYLNAERIRFVEDRTNYENIYTRNKIRNILIPELEKVNNNAMEHIFSLSCDIRELEDYLSSLTAEALKKCRNNNSLDLSVFFGYHKFLQKEIIKALWRQKKRKPLERDYIEKVVVRLGSDFSGGALFAELDGVLDGINRPKKDVQPNKSIMSCSFNPVGVNEIKPLNIEIRGSLIRNTRQDVSSGPEAAYFDWDKLDDKQLMLRSKKDGDRFRPYGSSGSKKISDFFGELKVPVPERNSVPLVFSGAKLIWVAGYRTSEDSKVESSTKNILKLVIRRV